MHALSTTLSTTLIAVVCGTGTGKRRARTSGTKRWSAFSTAPTTIQVRIPPAHTRATPRSSLLTQRMVFRRPSSGRVRRGPQLTADQDGGELLDQARHQRGIPCCCRLGRSELFACMLHLTCCEHAGVSNAVGMGDVEPSHAF
eukprot:116721-Rhodomonas_salina.3